MRDDHPAPDGDQEEDGEETPVRRQDNSPKPGGPPPESTTGPEDTPFPRTPDP